MLLEIPVEILVILVETITTPYNPKARPRWLGSTKSAKNALATPSSSKIWSYTVVPLSAVILRIYLSSPE
jgi:hypothetical protein